MLENKLYKCELVTPEGQIAERFFRYGRNEQDVLDSLAMFQWPDGNWELTEQPEPEDEDGQEQ